MPDPGQAAVEAVAQALFNDNVWITFGDGPLAKTLGGPREARYRAARTVVDALGPVLAEQIAVAIERNVRHEDFSKQDRGGFTGLAPRMAYVAGHDMAATIARTFGQEPHMLDVAQDAITKLSRWVDDAPANAGRDPQARTWGRLAKVAEECGEVIAAYIGATGQNPRKGTTHDMADVEKELLDVALTALAAYEHITDHQGRAMRDLCSFATQRHERALGAGAGPTRKPLTVWAVTKGDPASRTVCMLYASEAAAHKHQQTLRRHYDSPTYDVVPYVAYETFDGSADGPGDGGGTDRG